MHIDNIYTFKNIYIYTYISKTCSQPAVSGHEPREGETGLREGKIKELATQLTLEVAYHSA